MLVPQLCLPLCDLRDCSPPGSSVHRILWERRLEWWIIPSSRDFPNSGIESRSPALQAILYCLSHQGSPSVQFSSFQSLSRVRLFVTPWITAHQASLSITSSQSLLKLISIELVVCLTNSHPLSSPSPAFNLSQHQSLFQWVSSSYQVAKILEFQLQHQSFQWTPRTDLL